VVQAARYAANQFRDSARAYITNILLNITKLRIRNWEQDPDSAWTVESATIDSVSNNSKKARLFNSVPPSVSEAAWNQIVARDLQADFFYGVATTGVFCRPGCSSRRPLRANVRLFKSATDAQAAGFRPCKRCSPTAAKNRPVEKIRSYIEAHLDRPVRLEELGRIAGLSPFTVQRQFKREMGASPLDYQRALRAGSLRSALKHGGTVTNAIYEAGFSSASRAYEGTQLGMTPSRFAQGGKGERIGWCCSHSKFGCMIVGATERGLCWLSLAATKAEAEATLREEFPLADLHRDPAVSRWVDAAIALVGQEKPSGAKADVSLPIDLRGTAFQLRVWQALCEIPRGETRSYSQLARELGNANATRAVARACATNRIAILVPCHRVVGAGGSLTGYRWGVERKRQLLEAERG
jgi:AraC family transcriptional regulator, regulatory protein of adaptative response / methylated-DNA-[protein]-cysteine methyltransferase